MSLRDRLDPEEVRAAKQHDTGLEGNRQGPGPDVRKPPKLNERCTKKLAEDYAVSRATVYRTLKRAKTKGEATT